MTEPVREALFARPSPPAPRVRLLGLGVYETRAAYAWPRHQHLEYEAIVPIRGRYACAVDGIELIVPVGHALLLVPRDWHQDRLAAPAAWWALRFALIDAAPRGDDRRPPATHRVRPLPRDARALLARLRDEAARGDVLAPLVQDALASEFVWRLARAFAPEDRALGWPPPDDDALFAARLERCFTAHLAGRLGVARMARELGLGRTALTAACRRRFGLPPARAFARAKLDRAYELLAGTAMSVVEVADHLGYRNPFHFSRAFSRRWGKPPSRVRRDA